MCVYIYTEYTLVACDNSLKSCTLKFIAHVERTFTRLLPINAILRFDVVQRQRPKTGQTTKCVPAAAPHMISLSLAASQTYIIYIPAQGHFHRSYRSY